MNTRYGFISLYYRPTEFPSLLPIYLCRNTIPAYSLRYSFRPNQETKSTVLTALVSGTFETFETFETFQSINNPMSWLHHQLMQFLRNCWQKMVMKPIDLETGCFFIKSRYHLELVISRLNFHSKGIDYTFQGNVITNRDLLVWKSW